MITPALTLPPASPAPAPARGEDAPPEGLFDPALGTETDEAPPPEGGEDATCDDDASGLAAALCVPIPPPASRSGCTVDAALTATGSAGDPVPDPGAVAGGGGDLQPAAAAPQVPASPGTSSPAVAAAAATPPPLRAARPVAAAPDQAADEAAQPAPLRAGGACESVLRFRLAEAKDAATPASAGTSAEASADSGSGSDPAAAQDGKPLPLPVAALDGSAPAPTFVTGAEPRPAPLSPQAGGASAAPDAPHHQAAARLAVLIADSAGQVTATGGRTDLVLTPDELGRIHFALRPSESGLTVTLTADRPETLALLRRHAGELQAELSAAGYDLARLDFATSDDPPRHPPPETPPPDFAAPEAEETRQTAPDLPSPPPRRLPAAGLDLRL